MTKIRFKDNLIVLSRSVNIEKDVFDSNAADSIFESVKTLFVQNGWSPISNLSHANNGDDKVVIYLQFTVPQNDVTTSSEWLNETGMLMTAILYAICSIIDNEDTLKRISSNFHQVSAKNNIVLLPAPKKEQCEHYTLTVYDTGNHVDIFNDLVKSDCKIRTRWPEGWTISLMMDKQKKENLHKRLCEIGCEHSLQ